MNLFTRIGTAAVIAGSLSMPAAAQSPALPSAAIPAEEAAAIAQQWTLLGQGRYEEARKGAAILLNRYPDDVAVLVVAVETAIAAGGAERALDTYEGWLGRRAVEEVGSLRRIARAYLYESGRQNRDASTRREALLALARHGDNAAAAAVGGGTGEGTPAAVDPATIDRLAGELSKGGSVALRDIERLANTGSTRAASALVPVLRDPLPENRAAAAEALGKVGGAEHILVLRPLLQDPHGLVRLSAAGALYRLGDTSGAQILLDLASSEHASMRLTAAKLLAPRPDETWTTLVRSLAADPDPSIRLDAARLIAGQDPPLARSILDSLSQDPNLAIREEAALALADTAAASDLAVLRRLLRTGNTRAKVRAADRVLGLTR